MQQFSIDFDDNVDKMTLYTYLKSLKGVYNIEVRKYSEKRSSSQNRYFHGVIVPYIAREVGDDERSVKEDLKAMFLSYKEEKYGEVITKVSETSKLTTIEFEAFNEACRRWAVGFLGIVIPLPNEVID